MKRQVCGLGERRREFQTLDQKKEDPMKSVILVVSLFLSLSFYSVVSAELTKMAWAIAQSLARIFLLGWLKRRESLPEMVLMCSSSMSEEGPP